MSLKNYFGYSDKLVGDDKHSKYTTTSRFGAGVGKAPKKRHKDSIEDKQYKEGLAREKALRSKK